ncbi:hypothetical protein [Limosilactobacillus reuteri]|uniref:hypothetical protein n=1 Tax=Limosilactobacillus reuteri TaxID=1598 RepID=UPI00155A2A06|nr:hypothetical protein [Limosilactobacillus reuteri]
MTELDEFYKWYEGIGLNELMEIANAENDKEKRNFLYDLVNAKAKEKQLKIINGKFVM